MTPTELRASATPGASPPQVSPLLQAMWHEARGDWQKAHEICQEIDNTDGARVHAYLHRKEGDTSNAAYWYRRAGTKLPAVSLEEEWDVIVGELIRRP